MSNNEEIKKIGINRFIGMVFQTGTECLREGREDFMGEAERRKQMGLAPRILKPGEQIQINVNLNPEDRRTCECGCGYFVPVTELYIISKLVSPTGQEMLAQKPILICHNCKKPFNLGAACQGSDAPKEGSGMPE